MQLDKFKKDAGMVSATVMVVIGSLLSAAALPTTVAQQAGATEQNITVTVKDSIEITIHKINGKNFANGLASYSKHNTVEFTVSHDATVELRYGQTVVWHGQAKKGQVIKAEFDLPGQPGNYELVIVANGEVDGDEASGSAKFDLQYKAFLPSLVPGSDDKIGAPNTGAYVMLGGYAFSTSTIAFLIILIALAVLVSASRDKILKKQPATVKSSSKSSRKK